MPKTVSIVLGASAMEITPDPVLNNVTELINKNQIQTVMPVAVQYKPTNPDDAAAWIYPYDTITIIEVVTQDKIPFKIELQDVSNQPTWNDGTLLGLQTAVADINAWL